MFWCAWRIRCLTMVSVLALLLTPALGQYEFTPIVDRSGEFDAFRPPSINGSGVVAFFAFRDDGSAGIFRSDGTTTTMIVDDTGDFSFWGGGMSLASFPAMGDGDEVAFFSYRDYYEHGVYKGDGTSLITIAESGPDTYYCVTANPDIASDGSVVFFACVYDVGGSVLVGDGTTATTMAAEGGQIESIIGEVAINDAGRVAFRGSLTGAVEAVFSTDGGTVDVLADANGPYSYFAGSVAINVAGQVIFWASLDDGRDGIFVADGSSTTEIATTDDGFSMFYDNSACINDEGEVAFLAELPDWSVGIFTGPDPQNDVVIKTGDTLFGSTVTSVELYKLGLNGQSQIAFTYELEDGRGGIAVATPSECFGDLDGDGQIGLGDLAILLANYGTTGGAGYEQGDLDGDGDVDLGDLALLLAEYGTSC